MDFTQKSEVRMAKCEASQVTAPSMSLAEPKRRKSASSESILSFGPLPFDLLRVVSLSNHTFARVVPAFGGGDYGVEIVGYH